MCRNSFRMIARSARIQRPASVAGLRGSSRDELSCRGAAILSSLKRPAILSPFSAMKEDGTDGGVAVEAVGGGSAVGRGEAHAAGGGARAPALGATGAPRSTGRGARGPGGAAARQRRAGAGEQAPRG